MTPEKDTDQKKKNNNSDNEPTDTPHQINNISVSRPWLILLFCGVFFLLAPVNYLFAALRYNLPLETPLRTLAGLPVLMYVNIFTPPIIACGLFLVRRWGWILFLSYAVFTITYTSYLGLAEPTPITLWSLIPLAVIFLGIGYFLRQEISAPYKYQNYRGWRMSERYPFQMEVELNGIAMQTSNFSGLGFYIQWARCPFKLGQEINVRFMLQNRVYMLKGCVVRNDGSGIGVAFRRLKKETKTELEGFFSGH